MARWKRTRLAFFGLVAAAAVLVFPRIASAQDCAHQTFPPFIGQNPQSQTIASGATATMTAIAVTNPPGCPVAYQYQIRTDAGSWAYVAVGSNTYTTPPLSTTQQYRVTADSCCPPGLAISGVATITVLGPAHIYTQPRSQEIAAGPWTLGVDALGPSPQTYQWYAGTSGNTSSPIGGATASAFITPALSSTANYWVRVLNPFGSTDSATATITIGPGPAITTQPQSQTISPGSAATLTVAATGTGSLTYQWYRSTPGLVSIPGATASSYTTEPLAAGGTFVVHVSDTLGTVQSAAATITLDGAGAAPRITTQPQEQIIAPGSTATLSVQATGGLLTYQWFTFDQGLSPIAGATQSSYTTLRLFTERAFLVRVSNVFGTTESNTVMVRMGHPADIATQPQSDVICRGNAATIGVTATGTPPLTYQWYAGTTGDTSSPVGNGSTYTTPPLIAMTTYWVRVSNAFGTVDSNTATLTTATLSVTPGHVAFGRAGGSGNADVAIDAACSWTASTPATWISLSGNGGTGDGTITFTAAPNSTGVSRSAAITIRIGTSPGAEQTVIVHELLASGDFNGDGKADVLLRNGANGHTAGWLMNGLTVDNSAFMPTIADTNWEVKGVGDFDADGKADVIWRHKVNGQDIAWLMNGLTVANSAFLPTIADTNWEIVGAGDFDGDAKADVILRNQATGQNIVWLMNGVTVTNSAFLPTIANTNWAIAGVGDLDGDLKADVLWRNSASGQDIGWLMDGLTVASAAFLPAVGDTNWAIVGVGDLDGDGKADVVLRNKATGQDIGWLMDGLTVSTSAFLPTIADTNWGIVGVADLDGDGKADVVLRNQANGQDIGWLMNGLTVTNSSFLPAIADTNWQIAGSP
jgi:hypothetical protein